MIKVSPHAAVIIALEDALTFLKHDTHTEWQAFHNGEWVSIPAFQAKLRVSNGLPVRSREVTEWKEES